jgi:hypothetical protein
MARSDGRGRGQAAYGAKDLLVPLSQPDKGNADIIFGHRLGTCDRLGLAADIFFFTRECALVRQREI